MNGLKAKLALVAVALLALGAGVLSGLAAARLPRESTPTDSSVKAAGRSLSDDLQLSDQQRSEIAAIWQKVRDQNQRCIDQAKAVQQSRDQSVLGLLNDQQKAQYLKLTQSCAEQLAALGTRREKTFRDAVDQTKQFLDANQRQRYEAIVEERIGHRVETGAPGPGSTTSAPVPGVTKQ